MSEYERGYREALEAAAQACLLRKGFDGPPLDHPFDKGYLAACDACVKDIRALSARIAAPDDEASDRPVPTLHVDVNHAQRIAWVKHGARPVASFAFEAWGGGNGAAIAAHRYADRGGAPDDEALVEIGRAAIMPQCHNARSSVCDCDDECACRADARAIIAALREAGALR